MDTLRQKYDDNTVWWNKARMLGLFIGTNIVGPPALKWAISGLEHHRATHRVGELLHAFGLPMLQLGTFYFNSLGPYGQLMTELHQAIPPTTPALVPSSTDM